MKLDLRKLNIAMAKKCITVTELAKKSALSRITLTKVTTNRTNPKPATIGKIAKALNIQVEDLLEDEPGVAAPVQGE